MPWERVTNVGRDKWLVKCAWFSSPNLECVTGCHLALPRWNLMEEKDSCGLS